MEVALGGHVTGCPADVQRQPTPQLRLQCSAKHAAPSAPSRRFELRALQSGHRSAPHRAAVGSNTKSSGGPRPRIHACAAVAARAVAPPHHCHAASGDGRRLAQICGGRTESVPRARRGKAEEEERRGRSRQSRTYAGYRRRRRFRRGPRPPAASYRHHHHVHLVTRAQPPAPARPCSRLVPAAAQTRDWLIRCWIPSGGCSLRRQPVEEEDDGDAIAGSGTLAGYFAASACRAAALPALVVSTPCTTTRSRLLHVHRRRIRTLPRLVAVWLGPRPPPRSENGEEKERREEAQWESGGDDLIPTAPANHSPSSAPFRALWPQRRRTTEATLWPSAGSPRRRLASGPKRRCSMQEPRTPATGRSGSPARASRTSAHRAAEVGERPELPRAPGSPQPFACFLIPIILLHSFIGSRHLECMVPCQ
ncbi:hypothetical protein BS78_08G092300 [Paspalum vaginatum]|nr:hypothetical protein BS78_08G092300 [Paspalum vaginatum]